MNTSALATFSAALIALGLFATPAAANDHRRHGGVWWGSSSGYAGSPYDEYSYSGIRWYGDAGYRYTPYNDFGEGYGDSLDCDYGCGDCGDHGYRQYRHGKRYGHRHHRDHGHHRRHRGGYD